MSTSRSWTNGLCAGALAGALWTAWVAGASADPAQPNPFDAEAPGVSYDVPQGASAQALLEFIEKLQSHRPGSFDQYLVHSKKAPAAIKEAAENILALEQDPASPLRRRASTVLLSQRARELAQRTPAERKQLLDDVKAHLAGVKLSESDVDLAMSVARSLEFGGSTELAADAYTHFARLLAASDDEEAAALAENLTGAARRLSLLGKKMETLTGTTLAGGEFDWNSYRGKVVLVDFWATWCGPCVAELPNVRRMYDAYHERGFDVIGISLDQDRDALTNFLDKEQLPWTTLFQDQGRNPMASYYGVMAIPTVILVDRQGQVVSLNARGRELESQLEKLLGPVKP